VLVFGHEHEAADSHQPVSSWLEFWLEVESGLVETSSLNVKTLLTKRDH
jgi:hypothetical protein